MISRRDVFEKLSADELDNLIRWALHGSVAGATPSPDVWERIGERAERVATLRRAWTWKVADLVLNAATECISRVEVLLPAPEVMPAQRGERIVQVRHLGWMWILDHHRLAMRLVW